MTDTIIITRHKALVEFLIETGMVTAETPIIAHATSKDVEGMHVIGVLPLHLAALAATVTEIPLDIPAELRGKELDLDQVRRFAGDPVTYSVRKSEEIKIFAYKLGNMIAQGSDNFLANGTEDDVLRFNGLPERCGSMLE